MQYCCVETAEECETQSSPEKNLLAAVLEMAHRDLKFKAQLNGKITTVYLNRKSAIEWFKSKKLTDLRGFSFTYEEIKTELSLSAARTLFFKASVIAAEKTLLIEQSQIKPSADENREKEKENKRLCQRESSREKSRSLAQRKRRSFGPKNAAA